MKKSGVGGWGEWYFFFVWTYWERRLWSAQRCPSPGWEWILRHPPPPHILPTTPHSYLWYFSYEPDYCKFRLEDSKFRVDKSIIWGPKQTFAKLVGLLRIIGRPTTADPLSLHNKSQKWNICEIIRFVSCGPSVPTEKLIKLLTDTNYWSTNDSRLPFFAQQITEMEHICQIRHPGWGDKWKYGPVSKINTSEYTDCTGSDVRVTNK